MRIPTVHDECENCMMYQSKIAELEKEVEIQKQRVILSESQNYCMICGNTLDGYVPPKEKK